MTTIFFLQKYLKAKIVSNPFYKLIKFTFTWYIYFRLLCFQNVINQNENSKSGLYKALEKGTASLGNLDSPESKFMKYYKFYYTFSL